MNKAIIALVILVLIVLSGCDVVTINIEQSNESNKVYDECKQLCNPIIINNDNNKDRVTIYKDKIECVCW